MPPPPLPDTEEGLVGEVEIELGGDVTIEVDTEEVDVEIPPECVQETIYGTRILFDRGSSDRPGRRLFCHAHAGCAMPRLCHLDAPLYGELGVFYFLGCWVDAAAETGPGVRNKYIPPPPPPRT